MWLSLSSLAAFLNLIKGKERLWRAVWWLLGERARALATQNQQAAAYFCSKFRIFKDLTAHIYCLWRTFQLITMALKTLVGHSKCGRVKIKATLIEKDNAWGCQVSSGWSRDSILLLQKSWTMSFVPPSAIITRRLARWNGEYWLSTTSPWEWSRLAPKCMSYRPKALQVRFPVMIPNAFKILNPLEFQLLKLSRNVVNLYQLWKLFIWSRPRRIAWRDWWRIFNRKTEPNIELRMSTSPKVKRLCQATIK